MGFLNLGLSLLFLGVGIKICPPKLVEQADKNCEGEMEMEKTIAHLRGQ